MEATVATVDVREAAVATVDDREATVDDLEATVATVDDQEATVATVDDREAIVDDLEESIHLDAILRLHVRSYALKNSYDEAFWSEELEGCNTVDSASVVASVY